MADMAAAFKSFGYEGEGMVFNRRDLVGQKMPLLWLTNGHYVLLLSINGNKARCYDPLTLGEEDKPLPPIDDATFTATVLRWTR